MQPDDLARAAAADRLAMAGSLPALPEDGLPDWARSIHLLAPAEPGFWGHVTGQPEFGDGGPDPLDRWSHRVITALATAAGGLALFPFGGPPWHPFTRWALRSGRAFASPVTLLVHDRMGLWAAYRGAIVLPAALAPAPARPSPCESCAGQPCRNACPAGALTPRGYDLDPCHAYLDTAAGQQCMNSGCRVRDACPLSQSYGRLAQQSAHHMRHFHR